MGEIIKDNLEDHERDPRYWRGNACATCGHRAEAHSSSHCGSKDGCTCKKFKVVGR